MSHLSYRLRALTKFAVPRQKFLMKMDRDGEVPLNLLYLIGLITGLWGFVYLGSEVGFTIVLSSANLLYIVGYLPIFVCYLFSGGRHLANTGYFRLPRAVSLAAATFSLLYICLAIVIYSLPPVYPVTAATLNYSPFVGIIVAVALGLMWRFYAEKEYTGYPEEMHSINLDPIPASSLPTMLEKDPQEMCVAKD